MELVGRVWVRTSFLDSLRSSGSLDITGRRRAKRWDCRSRRAMTFARCAGH